MAKEKQFTRKLPSSGVLQACNTWHACCIHWSCIVDQLNWLCYQ